MLKTKSLKEVHNAFCDYEVKKAKSLRIRRIRTSELSRAMLAMELASLF